MVLRNDLPHGLPESHVLAARYIDLTIDADRQVDYAQSLGNKNPAEARAFLIAKYAESGTERLRLALHSVEERLDKMEVEP